MASATGRDLPIETMFTVAVEPIDTAYDPDTAGQAFDAHRDDLLAISSSLGSPVTAALLGVGAAMPIMVGSAASTWADWNAAVFDLVLPTYRAQGKRRRSALDDAEKYQVWR